MRYIKVEVYLPEENVVEMVNALNEKDVLCDGNYDYVFATHPVKGHFRPMDGANPHIGEVGKVSEVNEIKMEFRIRREDLEMTRDVIISHHPYEVPVINFMELID